MTLHPRLSCDNQFRDINYLCMLESWGHCRLSWARVRILPLFRPWQTQILVTNFPPNFGASTVVGFSFRKNVFRRNIRELGSLQFCSNQQLSEVRMFEVCPNIGSRFEQFLAEILKSWIRRGGLTKRFLVMDNFLQGKGNVEKIIK